MQVSSHSASFLSPKTQETSALTRQRTGSVERLMQASHQPPVESREDLPFVSSVAFAETEQRDTVDLSLPSPIEETEQVRQPRVPLKPILRVKGSKGYVASPRHAAVSAAAVSGVASDASVSSNHRSRVFFPEKPVTAVKEIPSCLLMTAEEKNLLYREKLTLQAEEDRNLEECQFEHSLHCCENAWEEDMFFRNHLGELVHPAHFRSYLHGDFQRLPPSTPVVGHASPADLLRYLKEYARAFSAAKRARNSQQQQQLP